MPVEFCADCTKLLNSDALIYCKSYHFFFASTEEDVFRILVFTAAPGDTLLLVIPIRLSREGDFFEFCSSLSSSAACSVTVERD